APIDQVRFRAGIQRAVRAPNVNELFQGEANGFPGAVDPCSASGTAASNPTPTLIALCEATGLPVGQAGIFLQANTQIEGLFGGNPNLTEETGDTITLGVVFQPLDNLDITIDYFDIEIEDAISVLGGSLDGTLDICYNISQDINSPECQAITRAGGGSVRIVELLNANLGGLTTSGIDVGITYSQEFDFGFFGEGSDLSINLRSTFLDDATLIPVSILPKRQQCAGNFAGRGECGTARNETQVNTRITWNNGPLGLSVLWRYLSAVDDERIENDGVDPSTLAVPTIDAINYVDLAATYLVNDAFSVNIGVKNIFDELPTFLGSAQEQANTMPELYDIIGPRWFVSASYKWE
ncbi:MAG: TonB-dependent receptor, partial [Proteobacteria bacterium]|nr:TonB-dependent receptor [Pseudomonadota bacterium]